MPDPVVTANLYCEGLQDQAVHHVLAPLASRIHAHGPDHRLWFVRYAKGGEHLKVRLHGPETSVPVLCDLLAGITEEFLATLPARLGDTERTDERHLPPIDEEDAARKLHPDRSLLWTVYRRSFISLGGKPFLDDDRYVSLVTSCLGRGCEVILDSCQPGPERRSLPKSRQPILLKLIIGALAAPTFPADARVAYLGYHRDWLVRAMTERANVDSRKQEALLGQFDQQAEKMGSALDPLREVVAARWSADGGVYEPEGIDAAWQRSVGALVEYASQFQDDPDYRLDPFATQVSFSPVFKVLHGISNQVGLNMLNEALTYHLLLHSVAQ